MKRILESQKMAALDPDLCVPCPPFSNTAVDLAGPFSVY